MPKLDRTAYLVLGGVVVAIIFLIAIDRPGPRPAPPSEALQFSLTKAPEHDAAQDAFEAAVMCGLFIKQGARDPDSVEFEITPGMIPAQRDPTTANYWIIMKVIYGNGLGAYTTTRAACVDTKDANGNWQKVRVMDMGGG